MEIVSRQGTSSSASPRRTRDQRKVALSDGFKEPVFLQESWVLGMADKGKVSMQDNGEETLGHSSEERRDTMATTENLRNLQWF